MTESIFSQGLAFLVQVQGLEEPEILAQAVREGVRVLFQDAIVEHYLNGTITRKAAIEKLGDEKVQRIDFQREVIQSDISGVHPTYF